MLQTSREARTWMFNIQLSLVFKSWQLCILFLNRECLGPDTLSSLGSGLLSLRKAKGREEEDTGFCWALGHLGPAHVCIVLGHLGPRL